MAPERTILDGATVVTMDGVRTEHATGHVVVENGRIAAVGAGRAPAELSGLHINVTGCLVTPGLVNTHHHLYQWVTRGLAVDEGLFGWLTTLYPVWGGLDEDIVGAAAAAGLAWLARTGCTTSADHHYVFPADGGDLLGAEISAARRVGLRFMPTRGSMDLGRRDGGLPPDHVVEDIDTILAASAAAIDTHHDPGPDSMLRIGLAPCSPFSVTADLLREAAALARAKDVRLHTHLAETIDEEQFCRERFDRTPVEYLEALDWLGDDVWLAHGIHFDDPAIKKLAAAGTGVAHCPSSNARLGAGIARTADLRAAGVPVGLGVDGAASNEACSLIEEARHALLFARARGGPRALAVRDALELATIGGARLLGWDDQIGSLEPGKQADIAVWRRDGLAHADVVDPVAALVLGSAPPLELLMVGGRTVVERDHVVTVDEHELTQSAVHAHRTLLARAYRDLQGRNGDMTTPRVMVNGEQRPVVDIEPHVTALDWLRDQGLTGAKEGCAEGECGACSVMVARPDGEGRTLWTALNACLVPVLSLDGQELVTAEGLGAPGALHPVQREMAYRGGSQCGYCTPGFICSMAAEYYRPDRTPADPSGNGERAADHEHGPNGFDLHAMSGNLCRCTGYRPIRDAAYALDLPPADDTFAQRCAAPAPAAPATRVRVGDTEFIRPADVAEAVALLAERPDATVIAGCTDWGVEVNLRGARAAFVVAVDQLPELRTFDVGSSEIEIGAALTLSEAERLLDGRIPLLDQFWPQFASRLIRNGATLGGNLGTASPIGDAPPALLALEATIVLAGPGGEREVPLADYFTGYRQTVKQPAELIRAVRIPLPLAPTVAFHKIAKRRFDDISSVAIAFALEAAGGVVERVAIGLGGVAATPIRATATEDALRGRPWTADTVREAAAVLGREGTPIDDHRASAAFRAAMLEQSLLKFHAESGIPEGITS